MGLAETGGSVVTPGLSNKYYLVLVGTQYLALLITTAQRSYLSHGDGCVPEHGAVPRVRPPLQQQLHHRQVTLAAVTCHV